MHKQMDKEAGIKHMYLIKQKLLQQLVLLAILMKNY
jgi:hypothetical protein